jgi:hypothetical protein
MMNDGIGEGIQRFNLLALGGDSGIYCRAACIQKGNYPFLLQRWNIWKRKCVQLLRRKMCDGCFAYNCVNQAAKLNIS